MAGLPVGPGGSGNSGDGSEPVGGRDPRLAGFAEGGEWDARAPGPELAAVLAGVAGAEWRCSEATDDELDGILRRLAAMEAWAAGGRLGVIQEKIRRDDFPQSGRPRHGDLPDVWSETVNREVSLALGLSVPSAAQMTFLAWDIAARLPGIARLLATGGLGYVAVRLISDAWLLLSDENAATAEGLLLDRFGDGTVRTVGQIANLAARIAAQVDPGLAERRRGAAQKHRGRVVLFRESSGTAALCGRDLPPDETLAAYEHVNARAAEYRESGAFGDARMDEYRATAYCDLLNGVPAWERIAFGRLVGYDGCDDGDEGWTPPDGNGGGPDWSPPDDDGGTGDNQHDKSPDDKTPGDQGPGHDQGDGLAHRDESGHDDSGDDDSDDAGTGEDGSGQGDVTVRADRGSGDDAGGSGPEDSGGPVANSSVPQVPAPENSQPGGGGQDAAADNSEEHQRRPSEGDRRLPEEPGALTVGDKPSPDQSQASSFSFRRPPLGPPGYQPRLTDLIIPIATLLGEAERPGESHGFGVLDPALCRRLAAVAILSPHTTVCVTVTSPDGIAVGHGCINGHGLNPTGRRIPIPGRSVLPLAALPARISLTVTSSRLSALLARPPGIPRSPDPSGWAIRPDSRDARSPRGRPRLAGDPDWCRTWTLAMPGGLAFTVRLEPVPTHECDHRFESNGYQPSDTLRHLVQVRDRCCTFPTCGRHARESDFEHAVPYHKGGRTDACNGSARSRSCHRVKQSKGWQVTQPRPGFHQWTTPSGRTYTQPPYQYPV